MVIESVTPFPALITVWFGCCCCCAPEKPPKRSGACCCPLNGSLSWFGPSKSLLSAGTIMLLKCFATKTQRTTKGRSKEAPKC